MASDQTLVVVNYFSARLTRDAISTARDASRAPLEAIVVDNSCDDGEWSTLEDAGADVRIRADRNLGYAGGINAGVRRARGDVIIVSNPDVRFHGDAVSRLIASIDDGVDAAGPALFWDDEERWILPPSDAMTRREWLDRTLAARYESWARARDRRRIRRRLEFWTRTSQVETGVLSGAVLAIRKAVLDRLGGFDESYPLYFEEVDLLRRLRRTGRKIAYVPEARCRHLYNQSASRDGASAEKFLESEIEFHRRWHGETFVKLIRRLGGRARHPGQPVPAELPIPLPATSGDLLVEVAGEPSFDMAAGHFPEGDKLVLPENVQETFTGDALYFRAVDRRSLETVGTWVVRRDN